MNLDTRSLCYLVGSLIYLAIRLHYHAEAKRTQRAHDHSTPSDRALVWLVGLAQGGLPWLWQFSPLLNALNRQATTWDWLGVPCLLFGLLMFWRAHADLGRNWSVTLEIAASHSLVTKGVYSHLRHPMYAAFFLLAIAQALLLANWLAGPASLFAVGLLYIVRVPNEERMMLQTFGDAYVRYRAQTAALVPHWRKKTGTSAA